MTKAKKLEDYRDFDGYTMRDVGKVEHRLRQSAPGIKLERTGFGWGLIVLSADGQRAFRVFDPSKPPPTDEDIAKLIDALISPPQMTLPPAPPSLAHNWGPSTLGHGDQMCRRCGITNREAAALGLQEVCDGADTVR